jgi:BMFP domain-containing protein YqiC
MAYGGASGGRLEGAPDAEYHAPQSVTERAMARDFALDDVIDTLRAGLSETLATLVPERRVEDLADRIEPILQSTFERFDLVPRRAFERQVAALQRVERRLDELEQRVRALEDDNASEG